VQRTAARAHEFDALTSRSVANERNTQGGGIDALALGEHAALFGELSAIAMRQHDTRRPQPGDKKIPRRWRQLR